jgi:hypothetical protein
MAHELLEAKPEKTKPKRYLVEKKTKLDDVWLWRVGELRRGGESRLWLGLKAFEGQVGKGEFVVGEKNAGYQVSSAWY